MIQPGRLQAIRQSVIDAGLDALEASVVDNEDGTMTIAASYTGGTFNADGDADQLVQAAFFATAPAIVLELLDHVRDQDRIIKRLKDDAASRRRQQQRRHA